MVAEFGKLPKSPAVQVTPVLEASLITRTRAPETTQVVSWANDTDNLAVVFAQKRLVRANMHLVIISSCNLNISIYLYI